LFHLLEFPTRRGESRQARALMREFEAAAPDSDWVFQADLMVRCRFDGPESIDWASAVRRASDRVVDVARILGGGASHTACARRAVESVLAFDRDTSALHVIFRWSALKGLNYLTMMEGRDSAARALLDSAGRSGVAAAGSMFIFNTDAGGLASERAADSAARTLLTRPVNTMSPPRLKYLSMWSWHSRDAIRLDSIARRLRFIADSSKLGVHQLAADRVTARLALLRGDTASAIRGLTALQPTADPGYVTWDEFESAASERLLLSQLQLATGDAEGAWQTAEMFDSPRSQIHQLYLAESLRARLRAAERLGRSADRARILSRLRALGRTDLIAREPA
jgi:hypothetical protein